MSALERRTALLSPIGNDGNPYIAIQHRLLRRAGFDVQPLAIAYLLRGGWRHLLSSRNVLLFHWPELRPFDFAGNRVRFRLRGWLEWLAFATIAALARTPSVYFVHDHAVHDTRGHMRRLSRLLIRAFGALCTRRVVHAPAFTDRYRASYLPHPLYWDVLDRDRGAPTTSAEAHAGRAGRAPRCVILGAIRPYKGIDGILEHWPVGSVLHIAGHGAADYVERLESIVRRRGLERTVTIEPRFVSEAEFDERLRDADVVILPHRPDTMLVSGAFFEAVGRVPVLVARASPFIDWAAGRFTGVHPFVEDEGVTAAIAAAWSRCSVESGHDDRKAAVKAFGLQACTDAYASFLETLSGTPS